MPSNQLLSAITLVAWGVILSGLGCGFAWPFRKVSWRVCGIAVALLIGFSPILLQLVRGRDWTDLLMSARRMPGGVELVFEPAERATDVPSEVQMDRLVEVASRRLDSSGLGNAAVTRFGANQLAVFVPGDDEQAEASVRRMLSASGTLEFSIVCNRFDHREIIEAGLKTSGADVIKDGKIVAKWRPVQQKFDDQGTAISRSQFDNQTHAVRNDQEPGQPGEVLILHEADEGKRVTGKDLKLAYPARDKNAMPAVGFTFTRPGADRFGALTTKWKPTQDGRKRQLAVLLNNEVVTAPSLNAVVAESGVIESGRFTDQKVNELVMILNAGALPVELDPEPVARTRLESAPTYYREHCRRGILMNTAPFSVAVAAVLLLFAGFLTLVALVIGRALRRRSGDNLRATADI
jgi:preprotein translocase subunit SecD